MLMSLKNAMLLKKKPRTVRLRAVPTLLLRVELEQETDGRWIADVPSIPGVMKYGATKDEALRNVQALALRVLADMVEQGDVKQASVSFAIA